MNPLPALIADLRERRLLPVAVALLVAILAVPVVLAKSPSGPTTAPPTPSAPSGAAAVPPAISVETAIVHRMLGGKSRDPFADQTPAISSTPSFSRSAASAGSGTSSSAATTSHSSTSSATGAASGLGATSGTGGTSSSGELSTLPPFAGKPKGVSAGLTPTQSYDVTFAITAASGALRTIDPLERLSVLPSPSQPLLVELGVLKGGHQVLFAVQPSAVVSGPGTCIPGAIDCEVLALGINQTERVAIQGTHGAVPVASFAVTGVGVLDHPSQAAANAARGEESAAGRRLLDASTSEALSLFGYDASLGAVLDNRNLTVGGS